MQEIPVYLFTGFMDSGKTTLIKETLFENDFGGDNRTVIIVCEDGDEEYDEAKLNTINAKVVMIEEQEDFTTETLQKIQETYKPEQIFVEYNGTWDIATLLETKMPDGWVIVQSLATVDATTFEMYLANMRAMIMEQLFKADVVIFNRCDDNTPKGKFRRAVKAQNRPAQIVYERADGTIDESADEELPFDIGAQVSTFGTDSKISSEIQLADTGYGQGELLGKKIKFLALVYNPEKMSRKGMFVPGRFAMTCCVEDVQFLGFKCKYPKSEEIGHKSWINITAEVHVEFAKEYRGKGPVLYPVSIEPAEKPEDELVYFS